MSKLQLLVRLSFISIALLAITPKSVLAAEHSTWMKQRANLRISYLVEKTSSGNVIRNVHWLQFHPVDDAPVLGSPRLFISYLPNKKVPGIKLNVLNDGTVQVQYQPTGQVMALGRSITEGRMGIKDGLPENTTQILARIEFSEGINIFVKRKFTSNCLPGGVWSKHVDFYVSFYNKSNKTWFDGILYIGPDHTDPSIVQLEMYDSYLDCLNDFSYPLFH